MDAGDRGLGMASACERCGGDNAWTGKERLGHPEFALGSAEPIRIVEEEIQCTKCGHRQWIATRDL